MVTDPTTAENTTLTAIETGDLDQLTAIALASTALTERPITAALAAAIIELQHGEPEAAAAFARQIAEQATPVTRRAHAARLRALHQHKPDLNGLTDLISLIDMASS